MFFQVTVSPKLPPKRISNKNPVNTENETEILSLAPFTPTPKLAFDNVKLGSCAVQTICIKNPTKTDIELQLVKLPPEEREVSFNWTECLIQSGSEEVFIMTWEPTVAGSWRDTLQFSDGHRLRRDIPVSFKSIPAKVTKKRSSISHKPKPKKPSVQLSKQKPKIPSTMPMQQHTRRSTYTINDKENYQITRPNFAYTISQSDALISSKITEEKFDDSLEQSPLKSKNAGASLMPHTPLIPERRLNANFSNIMNHKSPTFILNSSFNSPNSSSLTYVKTNNSLSQLNMNDNTYIKLNSSGHTYVKDSSIGNIALLEHSPHAEIKSSPVFLSNRNVSPIHYERTPPRTFPKAHTLTKFTTYCISPGKPMIQVIPPIAKSPTKKQRSPVKRLSTGYAIKALHADKAKNNAVKNSHLFFTNVCNPYTLAHTNGMDPFMELSVFCNPQWIDEQILRFTNWMNVLLMPPKHLDCNISAKVDVARLWQESLSKVEKAPSKEEVSTKYNQNHLIQSLRRKAIKLYQSAEILTVLSKCIGLVEKKNIQIRNDRNVHQNIGTQKEIFQLLFCYNPLWLRIGLETVFGIIMHLRSNSDYSGLSAFLLKHFFNNTYLLKKYKSRTSPAYAEEIKKHVTRTFLSLVFFLDKAKLEKLIPYDPCLFRKNAPIKENREILIRFSAEVFSAMGDIIKPLRGINYVLNYKQTYIHEFEYGVEDLGKDLKDGVRLARIMEIILLRPDLTKQLRVPAISRLQKIHNVKLAFDALANANYNIEGSIEPKDIVEGHREKTLSFLWQIIYKFQSPRLIEAVIVVQRWWKTPNVQRKLRVLQQERQLKTNAALVIQRFYRRQVLRRRIEAFVPLIRAYYEEQRRISAAIVIQSYFRMSQVRHIYLRVYESILIMQRAVRCWLNGAQRRKKREAAACVIQNLWRSYLVRREYLRLKNAVTIVSEIYAANQLMKAQRNRYLKLKLVTMKLQDKFRSRKAMIECRAIFLRDKHASCAIQNWFRACVLMKKQHESFLHLKNSVIVVQQRFRANLRMRQERKSYLEMKNSAMRIQTWYRSILLMRRVKQEYESQQRAAIRLQRQFRSNQLAKHTRAEYLKLKNATVCLQTRYRANLVMKRQHLEYNTTRKCIISVQQWYKSILLMRSNQAAFKRLKLAAVVIQRRYRANVLMRETRQKYLLIRKCVCLIQTRRRELVHTRDVRTSYLRFREAIITVQRRFVALLKMREARDNYILLKRMTVCVQGRFRANQLMKQCKSEYLTIYKATVVIQIRWRATLLSQSERSLYLKKKNASVAIQRRFRANKVMKLHRDHYELTKKSCIIIQKIYRGWLLTKAIRNDFLAFRNTVVNMQRKVRANIEMKKQVRNYNNLRNATVVIQKYYRSYVFGKQVRNEYLRLKKAVVCVERRYVALVQMRIMRDRYVVIRNAIITIQRFYKSCKLVEQEKHNKATKLKAILLMQTLARGVLARRLFAEMNDPEVLAERRLKLKRQSSATKIQAVWRGYQIRKSHSKELQNICTKVLDANCNAKATDTIRERTKHSLVVLINRDRTVSQLIQALEELEKCTRVSPKLCYSVGNKICPELYGMLGLAIRSRIDMDVSSAAIGILLNVAKYPKSSTYAWLPEYLDVLLKTMHKYFDKEHTSFLKVTTLLWVFGQNEEYKFVLLNTPNFCQQLVRLNQLCERQQKIANKTHKGRQVSVYAPYTKLPVPIATPDWSIEYPHAPYRFSNSLHAIRTLCTLFDV